MSKKRLVLAMVAVMGLITFAAQGAETESPKESPRPTPKKEQRGHKKVSEEVANAIKAYRENQTDETKAALKKAIEDNFDKTTAKMEAKVKERKDKRNETVEKIVTRMTTPKERGPRKGEGRKHQQKGANLENLKQLQATLADKIAKQKEANKDATKLEKRLEHLTQRIEAIENGTAKRGKKGTNPPQK